MFKIFFIFLVLGFGVFTGTFFSKYYNYKRAKSRTIQLDLDNGNNYAKNKVNINSSQENSVIPYLSELTQFPVLGVFFMEQEILQLAKIDKWQDVIKESLQAIQTSANKKSFSIWYHKALAECILGNIIDCEQSAKQASFLSIDTYNEGYLVQLFKYIKSIKRQQKKKKNKQKEQQEEDEHKQKQKNIITQKQKLNQIMKDKNIQLYMSRSHKTIQNELNQQKSKETETKTTNQQKQQALTQPDTLVQEDIESMSDERQRELEFL